MYKSDTIVALATGMLPSAIAVVRISGPYAFPLLSKFSVSKTDDRVLSVCLLRDPQTGSLLDEAMVVRFPGPNSYTGEDIVELHLHGSKAVVSRILDALVLHGESARIAEPGEFTRRAFENGLLDMVQVEGLSDLLASDTETQRTLALARYNGSLSTVVQGWRKNLIKLLSLSEAWLDFSDEDDVGDLDYSHWIDLLGSLNQEMLTALDGFVGGKIVREGFRIGLTGAPNAGKSSILNMLAKSDVAIVTPEAGTTRDLREVDVDLGGQKVTIVDSAGLRRTDSLAEGEGVRRALEMEVNCDLLIEVVSVDTAQSVKGFERGSSLVRVGNKSDLGAPADCDVLVSCRKASGFSALIELISVRMDMVLPVPESVLLTRGRDRQAVQNAQESILSAITLIRSNNAIFKGELYSEDLRSALLSLERLVGRVDSEDVLDALFAGFCIGK